MSGLRITAKLAIAFMLFAALLLASVTAAYYRSARNTLRAAAVSELLSTSLEKQAALESWLQQRMASTQRLASLSVITDSAAALQRATARADGDRVARAGFVATARGLISPARAFLVLRLVDDASGRVLASTELEEEGSAPFSTGLLERARVAVVAERLPPLGSGNIPRLRIGTPVIDADGRRHAVLVADADLSEFHAILDRRSGIRRSHDVFLADDAGAYLSQPRLSSPGSPLGRLEGPVAATCAQHDDGVRYTADYRGVASIITVRWSSALNACLVVKLDEAEAYEPIAEVRQAMTVAAVLALVIGSLAAWMLAGVVTARLRVLQRAVTRFARGARDPLPDRVMAGDDELGRLGRELGTMMASMARSEQELRDTAQRLEQRVADRTSALQDSEVRFKAIAASALDPLLSVGEDLRIVFFNPAAARTFGATPAEIQGRPLERLFASRSLAELDAALEAAGRRGSDDPGTAVELSGRRSNGEEFPVEVSVAAWNAAGRRSYTLLIRDITERKALLEALRDLSLRDELTGLHNRRGFFALAEEQRKLALRRGQAFSLVFIDLDGFKAVNDTYGHEAGDRVLQGVGETLKGVLRDSDILARLGGDEFVALLTDTDAHAAEHSVTRLQAALAGAEDHGAGGKVGFSFGVVSFDPAQAEPLDQMLSRADAAMYDQKKQRKRGGD